MDDFLLKPEMRSWFCCKPDDPEHLLMKKIEIQLTTNRSILLGGFNCVPLETIETNLEFSVQFVISEQRNTDKTPKIINKREIFFGDKETHVHLESHPIVIHLGIEHFIKLDFEIILSFGGVKYQVFEFEYHNQLDKDTVVK